MKNLGWLARFSVMVLLFAGSLSALNCQEFVSGKGVANPNIPRFGGPSPKSEVARVANWVLDFIPSTMGNVELGIPVKLITHPQQPQQFGDGVQNANLNFGRFQSPPFLALLVRGENPSQGKLVLKIFRDFFSPDTKEIEFQYPNRRTTAFIDDFAVVSEGINLDDLGWNSHLNPSPLLFRPRGWNDWFAVMFPQTHVPLAKLTGSTAPRHLRLPGGQSMVDPLSLARVADPEVAMKNIVDALGFELAEVGPRVHGFYQSPTEQPVLTATGTALSRYRLPEPGGVKMIYLVQPARVLANEEKEGLVSGTGPHFIGGPANAEIILNTLGDEPILTFYGMAMPAQTNGFGNLAWTADLTHFFVGRWQMPQTAFVAAQGTYHQHLTHTSDRPAFAQVLTPPERPSGDNPYGLSH